MGSFFKNIVVTFGPRLLASALAGIATYVGVKTSGAVQIDPVQAGAVVTGIFTTYAATHKIATAVTSK